MVPQRSHKRSHSALHLKLKRGVYYFRHRLPGCVKTEIALSLRTGHFLEAEYRASQLNAALARLLASRTMSHDQITAALRKYLEEQLRRDEQRWMETPPGKAVWAYWWDEDGGDPAQADRRVTDEMLSEARSNLAKRNHAAVIEFAEEFIEQHGLDPADLQQVAYGLLEAQLKLMEERNARAHGEAPPILVGEQRRTSTEALVAARTASLPSQLSAPVAPMAAGPLFSELLPKVLEFGTDTKNWRGQTLAQNTTTFRMFVEVCGDKPVAAYSRRETGEFYDFLRLLPAKWDKDKRWRGLPLLEIASGAQGIDKSERLSMKTVKRHFSALGMFFGYAKQRQLIEGENPAHDFQFPLGGGSQKEREPWPTDTLKTVFSSPVWTGQHATFRSRPGPHIFKNAFYWLPILALHHGNRLEEFAQLDRRDFYCEDGIHFMKLTDLDNPDHKLKNKNARRRVPLHPVLLHLGFLNYVETTAPNEADPVFPDLEPGGADNRRGFYFTKRWTEYRQKIGVYNPAHDYHSFRHTVNTRFAAKGVPLDIRMAIVGHGGTTVNERVYTHPDAFPLQTLYEAVCKLDWSDVSPMFKGVPPG